MDCRESVAFIIATSGEKQPDPHRGKTMQVRRMNKENTHPVPDGLFFDPIVREAPLQVVESA